ncbi:Casein kinase II subunit beta [Heracleum sosnowskyi]|uniref:Casein kinase II subunit beta n=1 Tax=Heracleum sosnowskyi TaxID=360622 RepID=A0AAD8HYU8_9APIA|nr:Casein kinase II subunit beta [Heracleum sosnowskyi]
MADREACDECKLKCSLVHGKKTDTTFIKILFGRYDVSKDLCLPQKVSQDIPILAAGENYILQDTNGQRWDVKLGTKDGVLAFREGWTKFYEDHGLRVGYILIFHYIRNSYFVVEIFDTTGFEKLKFPVATGKKRKRSEIEGSCNTVGECSNLSDHLTKKQGAAFSDAYQHVASANCDMEQIYMINRNDGYNYEEDRSPLLNLANSEMQFRVDSGGVSDSRPRPSYTSAESDAVAGILNENTVSAKVVSCEPLAEVISPTLTNNIASKRANVAEVDNDHQGDHPYVPPIKNQGPLLNLLNSELLFRVDPDGVSNSRLYPSNTSAQSDALAGNLNEKTVSAKVLSREPPAEAAAPTLSSNITSKRANRAEVDNDHHGGHPYVPPTENQGQVPSECRIKSPTMSSKRVIEKAARRKKYSERHPKSSKRSARTFRRVERNNEVRRVVKTKPGDLFNDDSLDASAFSFTAIVESHEILELPASVKFWESVEKKVVNLQGPNKEVWPVLYQNELGIKALTSGWENFYRSCRLRKGHKCAFILEDEAETTFRVNVT